MKHKNSLIGRKARYKSPYGESLVTIEIKDVLFRKGLGISVITTNGIHYSWRQIKIL